MYSNLYRNRLPQQAVNPQTRPPQVPQAYQRPNRGYQTRPPQQVGAPQQGVPYRNPALSPQSQQVSMQQAAQMGRPQRGASYSDLVNRLGAAKKAAPNYTTHPVTRGAPVGVLARYRKAMGGVPNGRISPQPQNQYSAREIPPVPGKQPSSGKPYQAYNGGSITLYDPPTRMR